MKYEHGLMNIPGITKGEVLENMKDYYGLFTCVDFAVPQDWLNVITDFANCRQNIHFVYVYDKDTTGCPRQGTPYPLNHLSSLILRAFNIENGYYMYEIVNKGDVYRWDLREPIIMKWEHEILTMIQKNHVTPDGAMSYIDSIDKLDQDRSYMTEVFNG